MGFGDTESFGQSEEASGSEAQRTESYSHRISLEQGASETIRGVTSTFPDYASIKLEWKRNIVREGYDVTAIIKHRFKTGFTHDELGERFVSDMELAGQSPQTAALVVRGLMEQTEIWAKKKA